MLAFCLRFEHEIKATERLVHVVRTVVRLVGQQMLILVRYETGILYILTIT